MELALPLGSAPVLAYRWSEVLNAANDPALAHHLLQLYNSSPYFPLAARIAMGDSLTPTVDQMNQERYPMNASLKDMEHTVHHLANHISVVSEGLPHNLLKALDVWGEAYLRDVRSVYQDMSRKLNLEATAVRQSLEQQLQVAQPLDMIAPSLLPPANTVASRPTTATSDVECHDAEDSDDDAGARRGGKKTRSKLITTQDDVAQPLDAIAEANGRRVEDMCPIDLLAIRPRVTYADPLDAGKERLYGERLDPMYGLNPDGSCKPMEVGGTFVGDALVVEPVAAPPGVVVSVVVPETAGSSATYEQRREQLEAEQSAVRAELGRAPLPPTPLGPLPREDPLLLPPEASMPVPPPPTPTPATPVADPAKPKTPLFAAPKKATSTAATSKSTAASRKTSTAKTDA